MYPMSTLNKKKQSNTATMNKKSQIPKVTAE